MLIPRPSSGEANANGGVTEHELDDMLWAAVELTVADHFAVIALVLNKGKGRDKWPTSINHVFVGGRGRDVPGNKNKAIPHETPFAD